MPKKHTEADNAFVRQFSSQLRAAYELAQSEGMTRKQFAESIGVANSAFQDLLDGKSMPSVRSLAMAVDKYAIDVKYDGTGFRACKTLLDKPTEEQLTFPFVLASLDSRVSLKLAAVTENNITLGIRIKRAG